MPRVPPTAMVPVAKPPSYLWRSSSGNAARPKVAVVATDDPQIAPKAVQATITAMANPPRTCPMKAAAARNSALESPVCSASAPIRMNKGMTERV